MSSFNTSRAEVRHELVVAVLRRHHRDNRSLADDEERRRAPGGERVGERCRGAVESGRQGAALGRHPLQAAEYGTALLEGKKVPLVETVQEHRVTPGTLRKYEAQCSKA